MGPRPRISRYWNGGAEHGRAVSRFQSPDKRAGCLKGGPLIGFEN